MFRCIYLRHETHLLKELLVLSCFFCSFPLYLCVVGGFPLVRERAGGGLFIWRDRYRWACSLRDEYDMVCFTSLLV